MNPFKWLERLWVGLLLLDFRSKRDQFYLQLARSIERKERLRTFLIEELKIAKDRRTQDDSRAKALDMILQKLSRGHEYRMSQLLYEVMPAQDRLMLSAVDVSKDKAGTLRSLITAVEEQRSARSLMIRALMPPMILLPGVFIFSYVLATQSIPVIVKVAPPEVWTPFNAGVRWFSEQVAAHGFQVVGVMLVLIALFMYQLPRWHGNLRSTFEQVPQGFAALLFPVLPFVLPLSIYRDFQVAQLLTSLAVLLKSGATLTDALDSMRRNASPWMRWHLRRVSRHLHTAPTEYIQAFSKGLLSPRVLARLATTIRNGRRFDEVLIELGTIGVQEVRKEIEMTSKTLNTILMLVAASLVLFLYVGQLSITDSMTTALDPINKMKQVR